MLEPWPIFKPPNNKINKPCLCEKEETEIWKRWRVRTCEERFKKEDRSCGECDAVSSLPKKSLTHTSLYPFLLTLLFPQLSSHFLSSNLPSPSLHFIASSSLASSFLALCPPFKVGLTLGVLNLQPHLCLRLSALTVNLSEKWRQRHIMIKSCNSDPVNQTPTVAPLNTSFTFPWLGHWLVKVVILLGRKLFN